MNLSTFIVLSVVVIIAALIVGNQIIQKKKGKSTCGCGSSCNGCSGCSACHAKAKM